MVDGLYPNSLLEALQMREQHPEALLYAGGTDLMVKSRDEELFLFLNQLEELKEVTELKDGIYIGACNTYGTLLKMEFIPEVLKLAVREIAAVAVRNVGTIGGNICNASPAGDTLPVLYAMDARVELVSLTEAGAKQISLRTLKIGDFITGVRKLSLKKNEILKGIILPKQTYNHVYYKKLGARNAQAISKLSFIGLGNVQDQRLTNLRIAFGAVGVTAVRSEKLEKKYIGHSISYIDELADQAAEDYASCITPIDDQRSTAEYRKKVCINLLKDFITSLNQN